MFFKTTTTIGGIQEVVVEYQGLCSQQVDILDVFDRAGESVLGNIEADDLDRFEREAKRHAWLECQKDEENAS